MRIISGILAAGMLVGSSAAMADGLVGPYAGLSAGVNWTADKDAKAYGSPVGNQSAKTDYDLGYAVSLQGGYSWGGPRLEAEVTWRSNDFDLKGKGALAGTNLDGDYVNSIALMGNLLYDIPTGSAWTPYLGAGVGVAHLWAKAGGVKETDSLFAYQGIAGLGYNIDQNLTIKMDYRYFATLDPRFNTDVGVVKSKYQNHTVMVGFTYNFGAPAPVAAPVAAPTSQNYLVFFDFDKSNITHEGARVVRQASDDAKAGKPTRIEAIGHTDTVGSAAYNMGLGKRRAEAVKAELIKNGVPAHIIETISKGKSDPLVPTADGVREPQNRRVQIVL